MKNRKNFIQWIGIYIGMLGIMWLFLILTTMIPNNLIQENMKKSAITIGKSAAFAYCDGDKMNGIADNYADSIWLNVAWYMGTGNPIISSVDTWYYDGEQAGENVGLYQAVTQDTTKPNTDYTRYWHGTAGVIRILHLITDVTGIRNLGFLMTLFLAAVLTTVIIEYAVSERLNVSVYLLIVQSAVFTLPSFVIDIILSEFPFRKRSPFRFEKYNHTKEYEKLR